jgi:predicted AAA+ superfamily ATPase
MIQRPYWIEQISAAWSKRSVVWLSGVRRSGKTTLSKMLPDIAYYNCDLPSVQRALEDPEPLFDALPKRVTVVFDEVHRIQDPSRLLKIAADAYPGLQILATGSSTLSATRKFKDSLTGRKINLALSPVLWPECTEDFGIQDLDRRMLHGGLPEALLAESKDASFFAEWMDSFFARDIQEMFNIRNRAGFLALFQLLMRQSGGMTDTTGLSKLSGLSRPTVTSYMEAMRIAQAVNLLPPFHGGGRREIVSRPKVYGFDTGLVTHVKGWDQIREEDKGILWEHLVFDVLRTSIDQDRIYYWRDKSEKEIDFVIRRTRDSVDAVECKIQPDHFQPKALLAFRALYPKGDNYVVSPRVKKSYTRRFDALEVNFNPLNAMPDFQKTRRNDTQCQDGKKRNL